MSFFFMILRAIQPFFEIIALSNMPHCQLEQIIDHIEHVLNKPIAELIVRQKKLKKEVKAAAENLASVSSASVASNKKQIKQQIQMLKKKRLNKVIEPKIFFQFIICNNNYLRIKECNQYIENLSLMTSNRKEGNIFLLTS